MLLGMLGDYADRRSIRDGFDNEPTSDMHRATLIGIQEMHPGERRNFLNSIRGRSEKIDRSIDFLNNLDEPYYHDFHPPDPEEFADEEIIEFGEDYEAYWY